MFRVGQKVVCVRQSQDRMPGEVDATVGETYTVRDIKSFEGRTGIHLEEIRNPTVSCESGYHERYMAIARFRPLVERKTDISVFKEMLTPADARKHEVAR